MMHIRKITFVAAVAFALLVGGAIGNGKATQDALRGTRHALVRQCDRQITRAVGNAVVSERKKHFVFLPF